MEMGRYFRNQKRVRLLAPSFSENKTRSHVNRHATYQVREAKVHAAVAAIGGAEEGEERLVLVDRQQLPVAERPPLRREAKTHDSDFGKKRFSHDVSPASRS